MIVELSIVMPCLNEAETLGVCISKAQNFIENSNLKGEIIVADNGSTDRSVEIAERMGAKVVHVKTKGYGAALMAGIRAAQGIYIVMGDSDDSYDWASLGDFMSELKTGADLVMGNRFKGGIANGAMPWHHRYIGNPVLSFLGRLFFNISVRDFHCGLRAFRKDAIEKLSLVSTGMEFASEMVVKASISRLNIREVPATLKPDGRTRAPHLRSFRDGWRHLRFLLIYSPEWLFLYPGILLSFMGVTSMAVLKSGPFFIAGVGFDVHTMLYSGAAIIVGLQLIIFAMQAKKIGISAGLLSESKALARVSQYASLERGILLGGSMALFGIVSSVVALSGWRDTDFGGLDPRQVMRDIIPAVVMIIIGGQICSSAFFLSALNFYDITNKNQK